MRKNNTVRTAALVCAMLAAAGCVEPMWESGREIRFGARSVAEPMTKTSYGEIVQVDENTKKQMVDWAAGDVVRIVCEQATNPTPGRNHYADYVTTAGVRQGTTAESRATLSLHSSNADGLKWGSTTQDHVFYAVYPSPNYFNDEKHSLSTAGMLKGEIPAVQPAVSVSGPTDGAYVAAPDMKNQYMAAKRTVAAGKQSFEEGEVFLNFTPITTAIEFEVTNGMGSDLAIDRIEIESATKNLSGVFISDLAGGNSLTGLSEAGSQVPTVLPQSATSVTKKAAVSFEDGGVTLTDGQKLTFTIFLLPESSLDDLTFRIVKKNGAGYIQTALKRDASTWITFEKGLKHFVKGLFVQEGAQWTVGFNPDVYPWDVPDPVEKTLDDPAAALPSGLVSWEIVDEGGINLSEISYRFELENPDDATKKFSNPAETSSYDIPVTSIRTESGTPDENHGWTVKSYKVGSGSPVTVTGNTFTVEGLTVAKNGKKLKVTDGRTPIDKGGNAYWRNTGARTDNLDWSPASWSGTIDLSKNDVLSNDSGPVSRSMRTANCYIIRHAGTYKIPLVYGNAIDYGKSGLTNGNNTDAYAPGGSGSYRLTSFVNHLGYGIIDPYIENNTTDGAAFHKNRRLKPSNATVVWQDVASVVSNVSFTGQTNGDNQCNNNNCGYITFTVDPNTIRQCNAVIAVRDASNNIMWSWHIWVTNDPAVGQAAIPFKNYTNQTYNFFPVPCIGWIEPPFYDEKDDVVVTLQQEESGDTLEITVKRPSYRVWGNGTYYQFGRKDPMPDVKKSVLPSSYQSNVNMSYASKQSLAESIKNPGRFGFGSNVQESWCSANYNNLWTGKTTATGGQDQNDNMIKTVYDPSPVGYKAPASNAFTGFTKDGSNSTSSSNWNYDGTAIDVRHGYNFTKSPDAIFFSAAGYYKPESSDLVLHGDTSTGRVDATPIEVGGYWSALPMSNEDGTGVNNGSRLFFQSDRVNPVTSTARCWGFSIRPVTE